MNLITFHALYAGVLAALGGAFISSSRRGKSGASIKPPHPVLVSQVPSVVGQLNTNHKTPFLPRAVFIFCPAGERHSKKTEVHLTYSVENGKLGLDWSRFTRRNIADKDKVLAFIQERHQTVLQQEDRIRYFRVEGEKIIQLGMQILQDFYHLPGNAKIGVDTADLNLQECGSD
jgi:hypothetical protein